MKKTINKYLPIIIGARLNTLHLVKPQKAVKKAFYLFCTPRRGRVKPEQEEFLNKAKTNTVLVNEIKLQTYHWKGSGKTILLVHGWESNTYRWKALIEKLKEENYNIYAFDAPAHGYSGGNFIHVPFYAKCVEKMVQEFSPEIIIGHSIGAMTTVFHQHEYSNNAINKLVLLGPPSELEQIMNDYRKILNLKPRVMRGLENSFQTQLGFKFHEFSIAKFAKKVKQYTLLIHDKYDKIAPVEASMSIHKNLHHSEFIETEGAGHSLNNDYIYSEIIQFLKK
ncbi:alpha/beta hydrolase [Mesonia aestuariivivens]|uniref:Alpha/beta hydrolase n=1 Tax=Mesonia aestuariivivens TaxID=2796128 RepID=A0ABS6W2T1_9FLAO|nr:alpha/beta hydrolase [Mesonia aestuariivivens]MBW2962166.1 alpha/beta hydrolase [Mesonia aestuariivivens]